MRRKVSAHISIAMVLLGTLVVTAARAQELPAYVDRVPDAAGIYAIWPGSGVPPGAEKVSWHEQSMQAPGSTEPSRMVRNVTIPTVTFFKPTRAHANGTALIVAPGGAFSFLMVDYEGYDMARWLAQQGVTAFVLKYRVTHTPENDADMPAFLANLFKVLPHPGASVETPPVGTSQIEEARLWAEEDGRQAIRFVRQHATEWGINPNRIGIGGFSAVGGVAMGAVMEHDAQSRPDFAVPIYAGYRTATPVPADAPPLFIAETDDDKLVAPISGARLYEAWHAAGKPAERHIFARGEHGFGMKKQNLPSDAWIDLLKNWLASLGYLSPAVSNSAGSGAPRTGRVEQSQLITITRSGSREPTKGPAERFTGSVEIEPLFSAHDPSRVIGGSVTFQAGARTAWHTHPLGQILFVTAGSGWIQQWGGPAEEIQSGDVVWIPAGVKHWHGATRTTAMTQKCRLDGKGHGRTIPEVRLALSLSDRRCHERGRPPVGYPR